MKLGGCSRMWIVLSGLYGGLVAIYTWNTFHTLTTMPHEDAYLSSMSRDAQDIVSIPAKPREVNSESKAEPPLMQFAILKPSPDEMPLRLPNGFIFKLAGHLTDEQRSTVQREYTRVLQNALPGLQRESIQTAVLAWLVPSILVLLLGLAVRWIYKGFKRGNSAP